jgi:hypothetical protein
VVVACFAVFLSCSVGLSGNPAVLIWLVAYMAVAATSGSRLLCVVNAAGYSFSGPQVFMGPHTTCSHVHSHTLLYVASTLAAGLITCHMGRSGTKLDETM